jgi:hypothetical protein
MIVPALLGAVILTHVTQVSGRIRTDSGNPVPPAPMPLRPGIPMNIGHRDMFNAAPPAARPMQNGTTSGRWVVLTGVIAYGDPKLGFAIIGNSERNTYLARPGEQLPDGSWIREIHPKHVVLEYGGSLETVGIYAHEAPGAVYVQPAPLPQQIRWEEAELKAATAGDTTPSPPPRPIDTPPSAPPRPSDIRPNETRASALRSDDAASSDTPAEQAQPEAPLPGAQDPADEFSDDRRQRAENKRK